MNADLRRWKRGQKQTDLRCVLHLCVHLRNLRLVRSAVGKPNLKAVVAKKVHQARGAFLPRCASNRCRSAVAFQGIFQRSSKGSVAVVAKEMTVADHYFPEGWNIADDDRLPIVSGFGKRQAEALR